MLELGCGAGVNLLSIASAFPQSRCVGVDLDDQEIARAVAMAQRAGLCNVEFRCADVRRVGAEIGEVDYIIVHGLWSWVEREVRAAIASLCGARLAAHGVAYISYNALPGWHVWQPGRELARRAVADSPDSADPIQSALDAVELALALHGSDEDLYGRLLAASARRYESGEPGVLIRDDLADTSEPLWLEQVIDAARTAGLAYLGEAIPEQWWQWRVGKARADRVRGAVQADAGARQQFADSAAGPDFKATLFVRRDARPTLEGSAERLRDAHLIARPGAEATPATSPPLVRELAAALRTARPAALSIGQLASDTGRSARSVAGAALRLVAERRAELYFDRPPFATAVPDYPQVPALARLQAASGGATDVTSLRHENVRLDQGHSAQLLALIDGSRDRSALAAELARIAGIDQARAATAVQRYLNQLLSLGLLVA